MNTQLRRPGPGPSPNPRGLAQVLLPGFLALAHLPSLAGELPRVDPAGSWNLAFPGIPSIVNPSTGGRLRLEPRFGPLFALPPASLPGGTMSGGEYRMAAEFAGVPGLGPEPRPTPHTLEWLPTAQLEVRLNQLFYEPGERVSPALLIHHGALAAPDLGLVLVAPQSHDLEVVRLRGTPDGTRFYPYPTPIPVAAFAGETHVKPQDGALTLRPNEIFFAFYYPDPVRDAAVRHGEQIVADFGIGVDPAIPHPSPLVRPELALTQDEQQPPPGAKKVGTVLYAGGLPVQLATEELIIAPRDDADLAEFLQATGGRVLLTDRLAGERIQRGSPRLYLVQVNLAAARPERLPQMLSWSQPTSRQLLVSSSDVTRILALALEHRLAGRHVGVNPRLHYWDRPRWDEHRNQPFRDRVTESFTDPLLALPKAWSFLALWDRDTNTVPVAFLDQGFSPNSDFRPPSHQCDMTDGQLTDDGEVSFVCGVDAAVGPPTTGASFFGDRVWHGNGVVTIAGGILNNGYGSAGTGGQVVVPMLYRYDTRSYVFEIGLGIRRAALDGAAVINISAGYPCRVVSELGVSFNVCGLSGQIGFCTALETYLIVAAGEACAEALLISAIPLVGPLIADNLACLEANLLVAAAPVACAALLAAGDVREPMEEAVAFALSLGVPIVASAGNVISPDALPESVRGFVNLDNTVVEDWAIVPASIEGVLCIAAAQHPDAAHYTWQNAHFHGDRVDLWAPIPAYYKAPPDLDHIEPDPELHERRTLSGTSAAAPYISGLIANLMALNPALNPLNPALSGEERRTLPDRIRDLLVDTAWTQEELETWLGVIDPTGRRRNLVRPVEALRAAAVGIIPDLEALGYDRSANFNEFNDASSHDRPQFAHALGVVNVERTEADTILTLPGADPSGTRFADEDWFAFTVPAHPPEGDGRYRTYIQVITPDTNTWGSVTLDGEGFQAVERPHHLPPTPNENLREWRSPLLFNGATRTFRVHGEAQDDNVFIVRALPAVRERDLPNGDWYDRDDPAVNPPESRPANDDQEHAVHLGDPGGIEWQSTFAPGQPNPEAAALGVPNLNFHRFTDIDWFEFHRLPPHDFYSGAPGCRPQLEVSWIDELEVHLVAPDGQEVRGAIRSPLRVPAEFVIEGTAVWFQPIEPGEYVTYGFAARFVTPPAWACTLGEFFAGMDGDGWIEDLRDGLFSFPGVAPAETDVTALARIRRGLVEIRRERDADGRIITPDLYSFEWTGSSPFRLVVALVQGDTLRLSLLDSTGRPLANATVGNLGKSARNEPPHDVFGRPFAVLEATPLPPDRYLLSVSHGQPNTVWQPYLPSGASGVGTSTSESFLTTWIADQSSIERSLPPRRPPTLTQVATHGDRIQFAFEAERGVLYRVEYADRLPAGSWQTLRRLEGSGSSVTITEVPGVVERWYRVRVD